MCSGKEFQIVGAEMQKARCEFLWLRMVVGVWSGLLLVIRNCRGMWFDETVDAMGSFSCVLY